MSKPLLLQWVKHFNKADADQLANLYHENATNHQMPFPSPVIGRKAIKEMFSSEFSRNTMVCQIEQIHECGEYTILEWSDPDGLRGCGFFQIKNGKILNQRGYWDLLTFQQIHRK